MTGHEYPLMPGTGLGPGWGADMLGTAGARRARPERVWSEMRLDWLEERLEAPCSWN